MQISISRIKSTAENGKSGKLKFPKKLTHISTNAFFWARWSGEPATEARCLYCLTRSNHRHRRPEAEAPVPVGCSCSGVSRVTSPERDLFVVLYDSPSKHHSYNPTSASSGTSAANFRFATKQTWLISVQRMPVVSSGIRSGEAAHRKRGVFNSETDRRYESLTLCKRFCWKMKTMHLQRFSGFPGFSCRGDKLKGVD